MINYYLLTKPKIVLGNLVTVAAGFLLASKGDIKPWLFFATLIGIALIMASACIFNNYIDRQIDRKMKRTKNRPLALGLISVRNAIILGGVIGFIGFADLYLYSNLLTVFVAAIGFFVYVVLYSSWKSRTIHGTAIGSIAGAVPPVIGYCAVSNQFDVGALVLFLMMVLWQMPHFFSIAVYHFDDYLAAKIPVLPIEKGIHQTKLHMILYIPAFIAVSALLTFFGYTGYIYLYVTLFVGFIWLALCFKGFTSKNDRRWAQHMFRISLLTITAICFIIPFDIV